MGIIGHLKLSRANLIAAPKAVNIHTKTQQLFAHLAQRPKEVDQPTYLRQEQNSIIRLPR